MSDKTFDIIMSHMSDIIGERMGAFTGLYKNITFSVRPNDTFGINVELAHGMPRFFNADTAIIDSIVQMAIEGRDAAHNLLRDRVEVSNILLSMRDI
jgi:hypothetical protein